MVRREKSKRPDRFRLHAAQERDEYVCQVRGQFRAVMLGIRVSVSMIPLKKELQDQDFLGLYQRPTTSGLNPRFLRECFNVDLRGGTAARRLGRRRVNNTALSGTQYGIFYAQFAHRIN